MSTITISAATKVYSGNVTALHGIDLTVKDGEMLVLVGPFSVVSPICYV